MKHIQMMRMYAPGAQLVHILDVNFSRFILLKLPAS